MILSKYIRCMLFKDAKKLVVLLISREMAAQLSVNKHLPCTYLREDLMFCHPGSFSFIAIKCLILVVSMFFPMAHCGFMGLRCLKGPLNSNLC